MAIGTCEECAAYETLYECESCAQSLCDICYGDTRLPECFDCLSVREAGGVGGKGRTTRPGGESSEGPRSARPESGRRRQKSGRGSRSRF